MLYKYWLLADKLILGVVTNIHKHNTKDVCEFNEITILPPPSIILCLVRWGELEWRGDSVGDG